MSDAERAVFVDYFPGFACRVAEVFGLTPEDVGLPSGVDELKAYAAECWDLRH